MQLPEELPSFPQKTEFIAEINDLLKKHKIGRDVDRYTCLYDLLLILYYLMDILFFWSTFSCSFHYMRLGYECMKVLS